MERFYYAKLSLSILCVTLLTVLYYLYRSNSHTDKAFDSLIEYQYYAVEHPIQPIPMIKQIDVRWVNLGKGLFHSPLLSSTNRVSCSSCHQVLLGGDDGFSLSTGVNNQTGTRNSPTVLNAVFNVKQFWDGRSKSLEEQIHGPIHDPVEMASNWNDIINKLTNDPHFSASFQNLGVDNIQQEHVITALTVYEKSLITPNSPIDQYLRGELNALSEQQQIGLNKFMDFGCITCHQGINIGGNIFQKLGRIKFLPESLAKDFGRYNVTNDPLDKHVFKVPSLRNILETAPYFHDGSVGTIEEAIKIMAEVQLGRSISDEDVSDLVALFESFSGTIQEVNNL